MTTPPRPMQQAQVLELFRRCRDYQNAAVKTTFPFKVGDLVTPRKGVNIINEGEPHIVLEIDLAAEAVWGEPSQLGHPAWGARPNIRVMGLSNDGSYICWWVEAFEFEPWLTQTTSHST
jgi:uncharacterized protein YodC (DUF2158 family)